MLFHTSLISEAKKWIGVKEIGNNAGPEVEAFQKAVDGKASHESWCMAFVQFCVKQVEQTYGIDSDLFKAEHCLTVWHKSPQSIRRTEPAPGLIAIWAHNGGPNGHTGIVIGTDEDNPRIFLTIEGNTGDGAGVVREGDGVYMRSRLKHPNGSMTIVGYLDPFVTAQEPPMEEVLNFDPLPIIEPTEVQEPEP